MYAFNVIILSKYSSLSCYFNTWFVRATYSVTHIIIVAYFITVDEESFTQHPVSSGGDETEVSNNNFSILKG